MFFSRIVGFVIALWLLAAMAIFAAPMQTLMICDFENDTDLAQFQVRGTTPPSQLALTTQHAIGNHAASIFFPEWREGSQQWPAVILTADKGLPSDMSAYDSLACEVFNASGASVELSLFLKDAEGKQAAEHFTLAPNGSCTVRLALADVAADFDLKHIRELNIFTTRPPHDISVIVDQLRLEADVVPKLAQLSDELEKLRVDSKDYPKEMAPLLSQLYSTYADLCDRTSKANDLAALSKLRPEVVKLDTRVRTEARRAIPEARFRIAARKIALKCPYGCGFASSMQKIFPKDVPFECTAARGAQVELAGNETESIQLVIYAYGQELKNTRVEIGPLLSAGSKAGLNRPAAEASPVGFVKTERPPYPVRYVGWYPDPILDFLKTFDIKKGEIEPVWIRVKAPAGTPAGDYRGQIVVKPANAPELKLELKVHLWGFDLPKETHLRTATSIGESYISKAYGGSVTDTMRAKYEDFTLSYRMNPDGLYRSQPPSIQSLLRWNKEGLNAFNIVYVPKPANVKAGEPYPIDKKTAILDKIDAIVPELKANGLYSKAYVYGFDEIGTESYVAMKDILGAIKAKYPDLMIMTTGRDHTYGVASGVDAVDAWCPLTPYYDVERAKKARARGKQVWWYICISNKEPFANWFVECDAIDSRMLMGLQTAKYRPDGFLYYNISRWPLTKKPITDGPYTDWSPASYFSNNGDGSILCAGPDGPLATIRLENARDGIEDNEYFWLLREEANRLSKLSGANAKAALTQAEKALAIGDDLVASMSSFSKSPTALLAKRRQVAEAIVAARKIH